MSTGRYERLAAIEWWDGGKVAGSCAIVVGAGALGNEVVKNLVLLGWGIIFIVDHDRVELSNLTRSVFFREIDVGRPKAEVLAERARDVNQDCRVAGLAGDARLMLSAGMVRRASVVFGCVDNVAARVALAQLVGQAGGLLVDGGLSTWEGSVQLYDPGSGGPCFMCGLTAEDLRELNLRQSCLAYARRSAEAGGVPTTPTVTSVTAALMVQEALKWTHRDSCHLPVALDRELRVDLAYGRFWNHEIPASDDCVLHPRTVVPDARVRPHLGSSWRDIAGRCQRAAGSRQVPLRLPTRILLRWECPACGAAGTEARAYAGDGQVPCGGCGQDAIPTFTTVVDGTEEWAGRSPAELGFPPWTWISIATEAGDLTFEMAGSRAPYDLLDGRTTW